MKKALIPGSFDPVTNGHCDLVKRACEIFDEVHIIVFVNPDKKYTFSSEDRVLFIKKAFEDNKKVVVGFSSGFVADYVKQNGITAIVKGVRNSVDFDYEYDMYEINRTLGAPETVFLPSKKELADVSSTYVRTLLAEGRDIDFYVPHNISKMIVEKYSEK